jgi:hypothetical protein
MIENNLKPEELKALLISAEFLKKAKPETYDKIAETVELTMNPEYCRGFLHGMARAANGISSFSSLQDYTDSLIPAMSILAAKMYETGLYSESELVVVDPEAAKALDELVATMEKPKGMDSDMREALGILKEMSRGLDMDLAKGRTPKQVAIDLLEQACNAAKERGASRKEVRDECRDVNSIGYFTVTVLYDVPPEVLIEVLDEQDAADLETSGVATA